MFKQARFELGRPTPNVRVTPSAWVLNCKKKGGSRGAHFISQSLTVGTCDRLPPAPALMPAVSDELHGSNCKPCVAHLQLRDLPSSTSRVLLKGCAIIGQNQLFSPSPTSCQDNWSQQ